MLRRAVLIICMIALSADAVFAEVGKIVGPLSCGIYDENSAPLIQAELDTQHIDPPKYTMDLSIQGNHRLTVRVHNVSISMPGERNNVSVLLDDKPLAKTSHQDVPLYLEVHVDSVKYRIICVRVDLQPLDAAQPKSAATLSPFLKP